MRRLRLIPLLLIFVLIPAPFANGQPKEDDVRNR